jgi:hypothetical protein
VARRLEDDAAIRRQLCRPAHGARFARPRRAALAEAGPAGDTLTGTVEIAGKAESKSRPTMGIIHEHWHVTNQKGELVMTTKGVNMVRRRPA